MAEIRFDLNDIHNEPSDEALAALMGAVAEEVRRRGKVARETILSNLRQALHDAHRQNATS